MELKDVNALGDLRYGWHMIENPAIQQLIYTSFTAEEARRIWAEREVGAEGTNGGSVADAKAERLHAVVEVLETMLIKSEAHLVKTGIHITDVVEEHSADVIP